MKIVEFLRDTRSTERTVTTS